MRASAFDLRVPSFVATIDRASLEKSNKIILKIFILNFLLIFRPSGRSVVTGVGRGSRLKPKGYVFVVFLFLWCWFFVVPLQAR